LNSLVEGDEPRGVVTIERRPEGKQAVAKIHGGSWSYGSDSLEEIGARRKNRGQTFEMKGIKPFDEFV
jgi:hypothetical protein